MQRSLPGLRRNLATFFALTALAQALGLAGLVAGTWWAPLGATGASALLTIGGVVYFRLRISRLARNAGVVLEDDGGNPAWRQPGGWVYHVRRYQAAGFALVVLLLVVEFFLLHP